MRLALRVSARFVRKTASSRVVFLLVLFSFLLLPAGMMPETGRSGQMDPRVRSTFDQFLAVVVAVDDWVAGFRAKLNSQPIRTPAAAPILQADQIAATAQPADSAWLKAADYPLSLPGAINLLPDRSPDHPGQRPAHPAIRRDLKAKPGVTVVGPSLPGYSRLQTALEKYTLLEKEDDGEILPIPRGIVFSGTPYEGVGRLSRLLRLLGDLPPQQTQMRLLGTPDLPPGAAPSANSRIYTGPLVEAVKRFQQRHGLRPDGYLDVDTINELNVPLHERVEQIRLALGRYRSLRQDFPQPPILINIPEFRLYAFNETGQVSLSMQLDVGQEYKRTPVLESKIEYLVFRPYWEVPLRIQRNEIVPSLEDDPRYLSDEGYELIGPDGKILADRPITKEVLQQIRSGQLRVRQKPGADNSLGLVKFVFPNRYSVSLHDVPAWGDYFSDPDREVTHGCIHVKEPAQLAAWMLRDQPEWSVETVRRAMESGPNHFRVDLTKPQPLLIVYMTAVAHENGEVYFYRDIYGYDAKPQKTLARSSASIGSKLHSD